MLNYVGKKCIYCGKTFTEDDDIVVCEVCGTPYHRECYKVNNKCINLEYHAKGLTYSSMHSTKDDTKGSSTGTTDTASTPMAEAEERPASPSPNVAERSELDQLSDISRSILQRVNLNPEESINGVTLLDFYLYTQSLMYTKKFKQNIGDGKNVSFNILAFLVPEYYLAGKRLYITSLLTFAVGFVLSVPLLIWQYFGTVSTDIPSMFTTTTFRAVGTICLVLSILFKAYIGFKANSIYFKTCIKNIVHIKEYSKDRQTYLKNLVGKFKTSFWAVLLVCVFSLMATSSFYSVFTVILTYL